MNSKLLRKAAGINKNPFYQVTEVAAPIIQPTTTAPLTLKLPQSWIYDIPTKKGENYILIGA
jgi:hypothetical protein